MKRFTAGRMNEAILRSAGKSVTFTHSGGSAEVTAVVTTPADVDEQEAGIYREVGVKIELIGNGTGQNFSVRTADCDAPVTMNLRFQEW